MRKWEGRRKQQYIHKALVPVEWAAYAEGAIGGGLELHARITAAGRAAPATARTHAPAATVIRKNIITQGTAE